MRDEKLLASKKAMLLSGFSPEVGGRGAVELGLARQVI